MKSKSKLSQSTSITTRTLLIYTSICVAAFSIIAWLIFLYLSGGSPENAFAAGGTFTSNQTGSWTTGATWNGGTAPSTSPNGDNITISTGHNVTVSSALTPQNNTTFTILGTLTINSNLEVKNNLILNITGSLIVNGNIEIKNGASVTINGGGTLTASGNLAFQNNANVTVNGSMNIGGNVSFGTNANFTGTGTVSVIGTGCSQWSGTGSCNDNTTLPVELLGFTANNTNEGIILTWKTASELNNDHFMIERSTNGIQYLEIATLNGGGTTNTITNYEYLDQYPLSGKSYYRLSQADFDGKLETFKPVSVEYTSTHSGIRVYPNPMTGGELNINFSKPEKGIVEMVDSRGYTVLSEAIDGISNTLQLTIDTDLKPGLYYLNYKTDSFRETVKLIK